MLAAAAGVGIAQPAHPLVDIKDDWGDASWIWRDGDNVGNMWVAFRKTIDLESAPTQAITNIAVDSKYWLWINGEPVIREGGLKRGPTPSDTYYDEIDLAPHLSAGQNTIAILVWYWGKSGYSHLSSGRGGLLFEATIGGERVVSDRSWKIRRLLAFGYSGAPGPNFRLPESNISFDAAAYPEEWIEPEFSDTQWPDAITVGSPGGHPWNRLYKRPVPQWRQSGLLAYTNQATFPQTATGDTLLARLPRHAHVTPYFRINATAGDTIDMRTDRYQVPSVDGVSQINTIRSEYITKDGVQEFETPAWMNGEVVRYHIPAGIEILDLRYRESGFDTDFVGSFSSGDPFLDRLWVKARQTVYGTMRDYFMETAGRERKQATSDGSRAVLAALYSMDERAQTLMRKFWSEFSNWRAPNGAFRSGVPGNWLPEQPQINLYAYGDYGFWHYYMVSGDREVLETVYPHIRQYLLLWEMGADGLVVHREGDWDWFDWEENIDEPLIENAMYQVALRSAVRMAAETGNQGDIPEWERRMESIQAAYNEKFWEGSFYRSPDHPGGPDDRGNAMAYLAGISEDRFEDDLRSLLRTTRHASPYMDHLVLLALFTMGDVEGAISRIKDRYASMVNSASTTLSEYWDGTVGSKEHPFATGTLYLMTNHIAGIKPASPGFDRARIEPNPGPLTRVSGEVLTGHGMLAVDLSRIADFEENQPAQIMRIEIPDGSSAVVGIPKPPGVLARIETRGEIIWLEDEPFETVAGVRPLIETDTFVRFEVAPGSWEFDLYVKPVPAQFTEVEIVTEDNAAVLAWTTGEERDSTEFIVEERLNDEFVPIGYDVAVNPQGGSYEFRIENLAPGWHTFRVRAVGIEGGVSFSRETNLEIPYESGISVSPIFPNPVDRTATVTLSVSEAQQVRADVVNALGRRVSTVFESYLEPSRRYRFTIDVSELPSGTYGLHLTGTDASTVVFVVAR